MSKLNEGLNKAKEVLQKTAGKVQENETVSKTVEHFNNNQYVAKTKDTSTEMVGKVKKNKYYKYIRIGLIALVVLIVIGLFSSLFGNKEEKLAVKSYTEYVESQNHTVTDGTFADTHQNYQISVKCVARNKKKNLYVMDTVIQWDLVVEGAPNQHHESKQLVIIKSINGDWEQMEYYDYTRQSNNKEAMSKAKKYIQ